MIDARNVVRNAAMFISSGVFAMFASFIIDIYLARTLGVDAYGRMSYAIAATIFLYYLVDFGINMHGTTRVSKGENSLLESVGEIYPLKITVAIVGFVLLCAVTLLFVDKENQMLVILYGASVFPVALSFDWVFQSIGKLKYAGIGKILYTGLMLLLIIFFVTKPDDVILVPVFQFAGLFVSFLFLVYVFRKEHSVPHFKIDMSRWKSIVTAAFPYGVTGSMTLLVWYVPSIFLEYFSGDAAVGYFNAADVLISSGVAIVGFYFYSVYPTFVKTIKDISVVQSYSAKIVLAVMTPICVGGILLADKIILFFYGSEYILATASLRLLLVSLWFLCLNQIYIFGLFSLEKQSSTVKVFAMQCMATLFFCINFIPVFGAEGAAISAIGCEIVALPFFHLELSQHVKIRYAKNFALSLLASGAMVAGILALESYLINNLFTSIAVGGILYMITAYCVHLFGEKEIRIIMNRGETIS